MIEVTIIANDFDEVFRQHLGNTIRNAFKVYFSGNRYKCPITDEDQWDYESTDGKHETKTTVIGLKTNQERFDKFLEEKSNKKVVHDDDQYPETVDMKIDYGESLQ